MPARPRPSAPCRGSMRSGGARPAGSRPAGRAPPGRSARGPNRRSRARTGCDRAGRGRRRSRSGTSSRSCSTRARSNRAARSGGGRPGRAASRRRALRGRCRPRAARSASARSRGGECDDEAGEHRRRAEDAEIPFPVGCAHERAEEAARVDGRGREGPAAGAEVRHRHDHQDAERRQERPDFHPCKALHGSSMASPSARESTKLAATASTSQVTGSSKKPL